MAVLTNKLKPVLDQPVWEWMQTMPITPNIAENGWTTSQSGSGRYIYYMRLNAFYRYDTHSNVWQTLLSPTYYTPATVLSMNCQLSQGTRGRILETITPTKFRLPYLAGGEALVGEEIHITYGPGAQETRTITVSEDPTTHDSGAITSGVNNNITDTNKKWKVNQWVGYTCRIISGNNQMEQRNILYNTENTLTFTDVNLQQYEPWDNQGFRATPTTSATYEISSQIVTIDSAFTVTPTANSRFKVKTGIIWLVSSVTSAPFFTYQMYDILTNTWYQKTMNPNLFTATIGTEVSIESTSDITGPLVSSRATSGTPRSITDSTLSLVTDRYRNYSIRIVRGTGAGQSRRIIGNKSNYFEVDSKWTTTPNATSEYEVYPDDNLVYFIGNANAATFAYHMEADMWITGPYFDYGVLGNSIVKKDGDVGYGIASAVRAIQGVTSISMASGVAGSGYIVGDVLTIATGTNAQCYVTATDTAGGVTGVELRRCGTGYTTGVKTTTGGTGTLCQINVLSVGTVGTITTTQFNMLKTGDAVTVSGATDGAWNTGYAILGVFGVNTFDVSITAAANLVVASTTTTTLLVDANESWDVNEHLGKFILVMAGGAITPVTQVRRITSNTANTITVPALNAFTPVSGTTRYIILDPASYGRSTKFQGKDMFPFGYATGGSTTTLVDTTKNWIRGNWLGHVVRVSAGTGLGAELAITANNATTLVFANAGFTPDTTTRYEIMDSYGTATSGSTTTIVDTTKNWVANQWTGKRLRFTGGVSQGTEVTITGNTTTTLTFSAIAGTQDTNSNYVIMDPPARGVGCGLLWTWGNGNDNYLWTSTGNSTALWQRLNINNQTSDSGFMITGFLADTLTTGTTYAYDGKDTIYIQNSNSGSLYELNVKTRIADLGSKIPGAMNTAFIGNRMCIVTTVDGLSFLYIGQSNGTFVWRTLLFW